MKCISEYNSKLINKFKDKLDVLSLSDIRWYKDESSYSQDYYTSPNAGLVLDVEGLCFALDGNTDDTICVDLCTGKFYGGIHSFSDLPSSVQRVIKWYQNALYGKGDINMSKKEINEAIGNDIQKLASDLTKKREMDKANSSAEDIAKKLGVKLPKSKK